MLEPMPDPAPGPAPSTLEPGPDPEPERLAAWLRDRGAASIAHPGGTLLEHLVRVHALLTGWGARPAVRLAGLLHASYGTDGFPAALLDARRRGDLAALAGGEVERLVYLYGACDRAAGYPRVAAGGPLRDRFTGAELRPRMPELRGFAEITVANELDVLAADAGLRARHGAELRDLFVSWDALLSVPARRAVRALPPA